MRRDAQGAIRSYAEVAGLPVIWIDVVGVVCVRLGRVVEPGLSPAPCVRSRTTRLTNA